jgi:hypothetical protein
VLAGERHDGDSSLEPVTVAWYSQPIFSHYD